MGEFIGYVFIVIAGGFVVYRFVLNEDQRERVKDSVFGWFD